MRIQPFAATPRSEWAALYKLAEETPGTQPPELKYEGAFALIPDPVLNAQFDRELNKLLGGGWVGDNFKKPIIEAFRKLPQSQRRALAYAYTHKLKGAPNPQALLSGLNDLIRDPQWSPYVRHGLTGLTQHIPDSVRSWLPQNFQPLPQVREYFSLGPLDDWIYTPMGAKYWPVSARLGLAVGVPVAAMSLLGGGRRRRRKRREPEIDIRARL